MMSSSKFLNDLLAVYTHAEVEPLVHCIKVIGRTFYSASDVEAYAKIKHENIIIDVQPQGFMLNQLTISSQSSDLNSCFPLLILLDNNAWMMVVKKWGKPYLYNPVTAQYEVFALYGADLVIQSVWECCPVNLKPPSQYIEFVGFLFRYFKRDITFAIICGSILSLSVLFVSVVSGYIFAHLHEVKQYSHTILLISFLIFMCGFALLSFLNDLVVKSLNLKVQHLAMPNLWNHLLNLPLRKIKAIHSAVLTQKVCNYEIALSSLVVVSIALFFSVITILYLLFYMAYCNFMLAIVGFFLILIYCAVKMVFSPRQIKYIREQLLAQGSVSSFLSEIFLQIHKVRSAHIENQVMNKWLCGLLNVKIHVENYLKIETIIWTVETILPLLLLLLFYGSVYFLAGNSKIFYLLQFMICMSQLTAVIEKFSTEIFSIIHHLPNLKEIECLLKEKPEHYMPDQPVLSVTGDIQLIDISLQDQLTGNFILQNVCMHLKAGKFIALIGQSGAGKSSLFKVLLGFESPSTGAMMLDGENSQHLNMKAIRKQFGVVLQTTAILPGTIYSNIAVNSNITLSKAWELAECVGLDEDIKQMPMKMHTYLSDNAGESISGGQKQKILIARALATAPRLLLLDEATSALDNKSQALIYANLKTLNITRFVIAHRYSTIIDADLIYVLDHGKIIDSGTYAELRDRKRLH
jgi:ABC-type bacteriocin/lantibiotic exporter with double-glycine peptidase domain